MRKVGIWCFQLGFEPRATSWKAQTTDPLNYGCQPYYSSLLSSRFFVGVTSVTRLVEILGLWQNLNILGNFLSVYIVFAKFWTYFGKKVCYWADFHCCYRPNIGQVIFWSHWLQRRRWSFIKWIHERVGRKDFITQTTHKRRESYLARKNTQCQMQPKTIFYTISFSLSLSLSFLSHLHSLLLCVCKILSVSLTHPYILCLALYKISVTRFGEILQLCAKILKLLAILKGLICLSRPVSTDLILFHTSCHCHLAKVLPR